MNFIKLKNNFICQDFKVLSEKVLYGKKFKNDFPKWKQIYDFKKIIKELIDNYV